MNEFAYIAFCLACTLAECMKDCQSCPFKAGLAVKAAQREQAEQAKDNTVFLREEIKP